KVFDTRRTSMTVADKLFSQVDIKAKKAKAKMLEQSIKADLKMVDLILNDQFARCFGIELNQRGIRAPLSVMVRRDIVQQTQARCMALDEIFLHRGIGEWFICQDSMVLILAVAWYRLVKKYH